MISEKVVDEKVSTLSGVYYANIATHNTLQTVLKPSHFMTHFHAAAMWLEPETCSEAWSVTCKVHC